MIKDRSFHFAPSFHSPANAAGAGPSPVTGPQAAGVVHPSALAPGDSAQLSAEAGEPEWGGGGINSLLQGLQGWGAPQDAGSPGQVGPAQAGGGAAPAGQGRPPAQVPLGILNQVLSTLKSAGGMATAGALQSLLSWGTSELENSGKLRPEFREILREAIDFAKENRIMSPEALAQYESRFFSEGQEQGAGEGKDGGCSCHKKGRSLKDSLQATQAA
jgi:hypothetical protein